MSTAHVVNATPEKEIRRRIPPKRTGNVRPEAGEFPRHQHPEAGRALRAAVLEHALDLHAAGDPREYSAVIARRLRITQHQVSEILTTMVAAFRSRAAALETGIVAARRMADEAERSVYGEVA